MFAEQEIGGGDQALPEMPGTTNFQDGALSQIEAKSNVGVATFPKS